MGRGNSVAAPPALVDGLLLATLCAECVSLVYILERDLLLTLLGMLLVVAVAICVVKASFGAGGAWFSRTFLAHLGDPLKKRTTLKKFTEQSWQLAIHVSMTALELVVVADKTWWADTRSMWNPESVTCDFPTHDYLTELLYMAQLAIWIYTAFSCKFLEEIRKDYVIMMTHHVVTIALVSWSYAQGYLPIGVLILLVHDASDIPVDLMKMANYLKLGGARGFFVTEILFAIVLSMWFVVRLYLFPTKLINSAFWENREACMASLTDAHDLRILRFPGVPMWFGFNALLLTLLALHIWWGFLLVRLLVTVMTKTAHDTAKDEYEGTSSDDDDAKDKTD
ncbi:hypothetical protein SPRG_20068 [Saprolegnia parasitica CBS 223.65]|uniref:TLC domain-containing protein n=1 Tax=Saprolegnia parasitica (strain CBS 223.65) TaxID=695850 RepID=A0A067CEM4_SAPPC|nr:hypothetical protein SPRG_20068 [Saprolegnia parasitica CBS 223.65]KDO28963.1 hypothetical protein SPRG_20068 [Saprolegnia parasitica CBS 223.65]|eukprot:XP_012200300.1 hypothetical protein SPRG_20068 [Saprolegnia parasitica CBS 223.65]